MKSPDRHQPWWGVQSSAMALMTSQGTFDLIPECAVSADSHWEPPSSYERMEGSEARYTFPCMSRTTSATRKRM